MHTHSSGVLPNFPNTSWISVIIFHLLLGEALSMLSGRRRLTLYCTSVLLSIPGDQSSYWPVCETSSRQWRTTQQNSWRRGSHPRLKRLETCVLWWSPGLWFQQHIFSQLSISASLQTEIPRRTLRLRTWTAMPKNSIWQGKIRRTLYSRRGHVPSPLGENTVVVFIVQSNLFGHFGVA